LENIEIRESRPDDLAAIEALYPDAFPDEDLLPLVKDLLQETPPVLSLVSTIDAVLVGHVIFTWCHVGSDTDTQHAPRLPSPRRDNDEESVVPSSRPVCSP